MTAKTIELRAGSRVEFVKASKDRDRTIAATVQWSEETEVGLLFGYVPDDIANGLFGTAQVYQTPRRYGIQSIVFVDTRPPVLPNGTRVSYHFRCARCKTETTNAPRPPRSGLWSDRRLCDGCTGQADA